MTRDRSLRAGDADRQAVVEVLSDAYAEGRLDLDEFRHRQDLALEARTYADLDALVRDLPVRDALPGVADPTSFPSIAATLAPQRRHGHWTVPGQLAVTAAAAPVILDFRHAEVAHARIHIHVRRGLGQVVLVVPNTWPVDTAGVQVGWGRVLDRRRQPRQPHGRVPGWALGWSRARGAPTPSIVVSGALGVSSLVVRGPRLLGR